MKAMSFGSYWRELFRVEGAGEGDLLSFLPTLVTALAIGVVLACIYYTVWRAFEARLTKRLFAAGATSAADAKTLSDIGYRPGSRRERFTRFLLRSPACMVYKTLSCDELDARRLAEAVQEGAASVPEEEQTEAAPEGTAQPRKRGKQPRRHARMKITPEARFYIQPTRLEYAESHALKFSVNDYLGLVYTLAGAVLIWFALLNLIDPLAAFLTK